MKQKDLQLFYTAAGYIPEPELPTGATTAPQELEEDVEIIIRRKPKILQPTKSCLTIPDAASPLREFAPTSDSIKLNKLKVLQLV